VSPAHRQEIETMANFDLEKYRTVQDRVEEFYKDFPQGSVRTFLVKSDGPEVVFEARVYRSTEEAAMGVYTSGWAREIEGKGMVNKTSHVENCESSAVGRALANLGYATSADRPSRSEMLKVARMEKEHEDMVEYIREAGQAVGDDEIATIGGKDVKIKAHVREHWPTIKEQFRVARTVVDAIEKSTGVPFAAPNGNGKEPAHA
jgi:hypothetical protein